MIRAFSNGLCRYLFIGQAFLLTRCDEYIYALQEMETESFGRNKHSQVSELRRRQGRNSKMRMNIGLGLDCARHHRQLTIRCGSPDKPSGHR